MVKICIKLLSSILVLCMFNAAAAAFAQQVVVTVDQDGETSPMREYVEDAVIGGLFDAGYIVWSDNPHGFLGTDGSGDNRIPLQMEYAAVRYARENGADILVQVRVPSADFEMENPAHFAVIDIHGPSVLISDSMQGEEYRNSDMDLRKSSLKLGRLIAEQVHAEIRRDQQNR
ncbi:MAG: hypothetical protein ACOCVC_00340 [Spirochaeta sp.]